MASGLNIHIDKENATPSFVPNKGGKGMLAQATPRKALYDVNKDMTRPLPMKSSLNEGFTKPSTDRHRPVRKKTTPLAPKKEPHKKLSLLENENAQRKEVNPHRDPTTTKASKLKKKMQKKPESFSDEDDGFDSDTIWPRAERLSTHLHSILAWRPSCLAPAQDDLENDLDYMYDGEIPDQIIIDPPSPHCPFELPEIDMASILASLPDPEKPEMP